MAGGNRDEVKAFLTTRRAKITPEQAGLSSYGRTRRVSGLRRSEVADLAGVSVEYYAQLERGNLSGASDSVLDAIARALQLDDAERDHLLRLARAAQPGNRRPRKATPAPVAIRVSVQRMLDGMTALPAIVGNGRLDILAANALGRALYAPAFAATARPVNLARFNFLDSQAHAFWGNWAATADDTVAMLRAEAGRDPYDRARTDLVGELCTRSEEFRTRWAAHNVRAHRTGSKQIQHPLVGELQLSYENLQLTADPGLTMTVFNAVHGSATDDALRILASWATTRGNEPKADHTQADPLSRPQ